jgi:hypothetical protein
VTAVGTPSVGYRRGSGGGDMRRYRNLLIDSARWEGFELRDDDIVLSTPAKCGTTWLQMILALLILQDPALPAPLTHLSPWIDVQTEPLADVRAALAAQTHRRFIKSHTPLDGLPRRDGVTYITVGRDPRDVALSWDHHVDNMNLERIFTARVDAVGADDLEEVLGRGGPPPRLDDVRDRFWAWVDDDQPVDENLMSLRGTLHHLATFWDRRDDPNVVVLHYADLQADLDGSMRSLAARLAIDVDETRWDSLVDAATFDHMRVRADELAPQVKIDGFWHDTSAFFHKGASGQWRELLADDDDLARYEARVTALAPADLVEWVHRG